MEPSEWFFIQKSNKAALVQLVSKTVPSTEISQLKGFPPGELDRPQGVAAPEENGQWGCTSLALFMVCAVIHVHIRIKEWVSSEIRVGGSGKTVLCSLVFEGLCPWVKAEIQQGSVSFAAFTALLGLIDGVVITMVPFRPEFPPYPLTVHGEIDQLTCRWEGKHRSDFKGTIYLRYGLNGNIEILALWTGTARSLAYERKSTLPRHPICPYPPMKNHGKHLCMVYKLPSLWRSIMAG